jgi:hypothetical protein
MPHPPLAAPTQLGTLMPSTLPDLLFRLVVPLLKPHLDSISTRAPLVVLAHANGVPGPDPDPAPVVEVVEGGEGGAVDAGAAGGRPGSVRPGVRASSGGGGGGGDGGTRGGSSARGGGVGVPSASGVGSGVEPPLLATIEACVRDWEVLLPWVGELARLAPLPRLPQAPGTTAPGAGGADGCEGAGVGLAPGARALRATSGAGGVVGVVRESRAARGATWTPWHSAAAAAAPAPYPLLADGTHTEVARVVAAAATAFGLCVFRPEALEVPKRLEARLVAVQRAVTSYVL